MPYLQSIAPIISVIPTSGSNPVLILSEDLNEYYCKYSRHVPAHKLLFEFLASSYLNIWQIPTPDFSIVNIKDEHIPQDLLSNRLSRTDFHIPSFGSKHLTNSQEIDESVILSWKQKKAQIKRVINKEDFLKIGLFDLWLANEDRNHNNMNLMIQSQSKGQVLYAIDHEKCFNSGILAESHSVTQLTEDESILTSPMAVLWEKDLYLEFTIEDILHEMPQWIQNCRLATANILQQVPVEWGINIANLELLLNNNIFAAPWIAATEQNFKNYIRI